MRVGVVGSGYVGLVTGICLADAGNQVVCVDRDAGKVERLRRGEVPIFEPGLQSLLKRVVRERRIAFTTEHAEAVRGSRAVFIAVDTPEGSTGAPDLRALEGAVRDVLQALDGPLILVLKSTVPVGTAGRVAALARERGAHPVAVVSNPEFLKEGAALEDFLRPDRIVVGTDSDDAFAVMSGLYRPFLRAGRPILRMTNQAAELTKYAANAMLATRISFINEIARLCDAVGADVRDVARGIGTDERIGESFLYAGCGYGGSCFPKDTQGLIHVANLHGVPARIVAAAEAVNDEQKRLLAQRALARFGPRLTGKHFALWGLAFKPQTDDVREAPALIVAQLLHEAGATLTGSDPEAMQTFARACTAPMTFEEDPYEAARGADAVILCTEWNEFRTPDWERLRSLMRTPVVLDGRNVLDGDAARAAGFEYSGVGLGRGADLAAAAVEPQRRTSSPPRARAEMQAENPPAGRAT